VYLGMKILQNQIIGTQTSFSTNFGSKLNRVSSCLSSFLSASTAATYTFTASTLYNEFQHFILRFDKISLFCGYH